ncbi:hypothetical protein LO772_33150 [Yinghuangia sp. ASG 101]|uniref:hypothetical protein n=1 Tax=Yinghuangia sp. ASG 101 TaxID=2896848 RepID=UPI001E5F3F02|nr:hypothetical protein [Yinghuangia sp. ASG 101]UGQ11570.1 hypothetical protein LO772_33150 [Yinghuangia sp. ASG 101]
MKDPAGAAEAPRGFGLTYPRPWLALKEPVNPYSTYHTERTERFLQPLEPVIERDRETIGRMRAFERRQPGYQTAGGEVYTHREPGSERTKLVFRGREGRERVLVENFKPSMEYPDVYPNGFWLSPDGRHVIYSDADPVHEGGAVLHTVRTDTGAHVGAPLTQALYPSGSWIDDKRFVYSLRAARKARPWETHWSTYLRHVDDDGTIRDQPLPEIERTADESRYDFTPGPVPGTVTVLSYSTVINTPQTIAVFDLDGKNRGFVVQRESERVLGRVRLGPAQSDGSRQMFVLRADRRSRRSGRVVVVDPRGKPHRRPRLRQVVAGRRGDVIREIEVIDRGQGQPPSLALSIRRHGGEVRVDVVDLKRTAKWRGGLKAATRWTVPLPGAQQVRSHRNRGRGRGKDRIKGWYGTISAMTTTRGEGGVGGGLEIEYAARESVPHRLYRLAAPRPGAVPRQVAGPTTEAARAAGVPQVDVTLHRPRAGLFRKTSLHVVRPTNAPGNQRIPQVYTAYPYYNLGGHNQNFTPFAATIVAKDIAWVSHSVYGTGAQGYDELLGPRAKARAKALKEMRTALRYLDRLPGLAGAEQRTGFFQSAGGMIGLDALRHAPESFRNILFNRTLVSVLESNSQRVHMNVDDPRDRRAAYAHSGGITEAIRKPPENVVYTLGSSDPRIPDYSVRMGAAAFDEARARYFGDKIKTPGGTYLIEQQASGHFPGGNEQSTIAAVVGRLAGRHPAPRPQLNSGAPGTPAAVVPNVSAPLPSAPRPATATAASRNSPRTGLGEPGSVHTFGSGMENAAVHSASSGLGSMPRLRTIMRRISAATRRATDPHGDRAAVREIATRRKAVEQHVPELARRKHKQR